MAAKKKTETEKTEKPAKAEKPAAKAEKAPEPKAEKPKAAKAAAPAPAPTPAPAKAAAPAPAAEIHHPPVAAATPNDPFDAATLDASFDAALDVVKRTSPARHEALVQAWLAHKNAAAIDAASQDDVASTARKPARRALGILKSRGIAIPARAPKVASLVQKSTSTMEARCLFPDGRGAQMWWIARVESTGRTEVVEVTTLDRQGIMGVNRGSPTAGNLKQVYQGWQARVGRAPQEVPVAYAQHRIDEARKLSAARKQVLPMGLDAANDLLFPDGKTAPKAPAKHPIEGEDLAIPKDEKAVKARLENSMHLHEQPEFGPWLPDDSVSVEVIKTINERVLALPEADRVQEKIDTIVKGVIDDAADAYFNEERKGLYMRRMMDAAWSLYRAGLVDKAIDALLVAEAIHKAGIVSDRPSEIPFVRGLFIKLLAVAQQRAGALDPRANEEAARLA
jgi:hypothetical protein